MNALTVLKDAYALIRNKEAWTTEVAARDTAGNHVGAWTPHATRFCALGALYRVSGGNGTFAPPEFEEARLLLARAIFPSCDDTEHITATLVAQINDEKGHEAITAAFRKAIADATPREGAPTESRELVTA